MNEPNVVQKFIWIGERAILLLIAGALLSSLVHPLVCREYSYKSLVAVEPPVKSPVTKIFLLIYFLNRRP